MNATEAKIVSMVTLGIGSLIAGMLPAWFSERARQRHPLLLSCLLCLGAGVLLATSLVHMLPEARADLPNYSELALCAGFFLVYLVDEIVHFFYGTEGSHANEYTRIADYGSNERTTLIEQASAPDDELRVPTPCCGDQQNPRMCHVSHTEPCNKSSSGIIGLLCALFVHSVLEGLAIGLQETASQVLLLLGAVSSHKYVVGFCLGAELADSTNGRMSMHVICVVLFSAGSVLGIGLGLGLEVVKSIQDSIAVPIMQALAAGTLLYVTVSEVLPRERARWHERKRIGGLAQLAAVLTGFGLMYLSTKYLDAD